MAHDATRSPARRSSIRRCSRGSATSSCSRGPSSTASSTGCTGRRTSARRSTSPSIAATSPGDDIRRIDWRLYARTDRFYLKSTKPTPTRTSPCCSTCRRRWDSAAAASRSSTTPLSRRVPRVPGAAPARSRRHSHVRSRRACTRAAVGQAPQRDCCTRSIERRPSGRGSWSRRCRRWRSTSAAASMVVLISDFYEDPDAMLDALSRSGSSATT